MSRRFLDRISSRFNRLRSLILDQGSDDSDILEMRSSDVSHTNTDTNAKTFGRAKKISGANGGLLIQGSSDTGALGLQLSGDAPTPTNTRSNTGEACVTIAANDSASAIAADQNVLRILGSNAATRFIFDADGSAFSDVAFGDGDWDKEDDLAMLKDIDTLRRTAGKDLLKANVGPMIKYQRKYLEKNKLWKFNENGHHFMNWPRMILLHHGAITQLGDKTNKRFEVLEQRLTLSDKIIAALESKLKAIKDETREDKIHPSDHT